MSNPISPEVLKGWEEAVSARWDKIERLQETIQEALEQIQELTANSTDQQLQREFKERVTHPYSIRHDEQLNWYIQTYSKIPVDLRKIPKTLLSRLADNIRTRPLTNRPAARLLAAQEREHNAEMLEAVVNPTLLPHLRTVDSDRRAKFEEQNRILVDLLATATSVPR